MLHTLALVEIENGSAEHLLEAFFQIAFIDGDLPAQGFDGKGLADLVEQDLPGADDLFAVCFVCQELTLEPFHFFFPDHTFEAVHQQHLALSVDEDVLHAVGIGMIEQGFQYQTGPSAK